MRSQMSCAILCGTIQTHQAIGGTIALALTSTFSGETCMATEDPTASVPDFPEESPSQKHRGRIGSFASRTHCLAGHPYDEANTYRKPDGSRRCRICHTAREAARRKQSPIDWHVHEQRNCPECGARFVSVNSVHIYCTIACSAASRRLTDADFWARVDKDSDPNGCWLFTGFVGKGSINYGNFQHSGAHRYAYQLYYPDDILTADDHICHTCDNPPCVRKEHLFKGTALLNMQDRDAKGRTLPGRKKLTPSAVQAFREAYARGDVTQYTLAERYGISQRHASRILSDAHAKRHKEQL